jgi:hypothetical protein
MAFGAASALSLPIIVSFSVPGGNMSLAAGILLGVLCFAGYCFRYKGRELIGIMRCLR